MGDFIGWLCHYTPVEVITAAGYIPLRLLGRKGNNSRSATYFSGNLCPYVQSCLEAALRHELPPLKGVVIARSCNAMMHLANLWPRYITRGQTFVLDVPRRFDDDAVLYFAQNLRRLTKELTGTTNIDKENLWTAINWWEEQREGWRELLSRRAEETPLSGTEIMAKLTRWQSPAASVKATNSQAFISLTADGKQKKDVERPRLFLAGSIIPQELVEMIEELGGLVTFADGCNGWRLLLAPVTGDERDPFLYLAKLYLGGPPCPRMVPVRGWRSRYWAAAVEQFQIRGAIYHAMKFCDAAVYDFLALKNFCEKRGLPLLRLDGDFSGGNRGQWRTRIEAFLEMLEVQ
ncbi:2-hydroxyacyl-CoA dehydratase subunit D [Neomoorella humiferrea]|uniref:R-phenyllactate dehydratase beta subunit n=1 Tax=Neomoorella humiferrea TaxID=676965 RepID=A0A2T0AY55_9FIRM|nr:2-hydroxyacyl-CoA dehydratase family protein [Moorella humiferrea]PRR75813.1 R-phenyllactate dehydratase beta subunit [Moorella humiferrea]